MDVSRVRMRSSQSRATTLWNSLRCAPPSSPSWLDKSRTLNECAILVVLLYCKNY